MAEDEAVAKEDEVSTSSQYASHARALQTFIEKVTVFRAATKYVYTDLSLRTDSNDAADAPRNCKLAELYSRYYEYADLLATQGLVDDAVKYIELAPADYKGAVTNLDSKLHVNSYLGLRRGELLLQRLMPRPRRVFLPIVTLCGVPTKLHSIFYLWCEWRRCWCGSWPYAPRGV